MSYDGKMFLELFLLWVDGRVLSRIAENILWMQTFLVKKYILSGN